jgi:hypothetical protein
MQQRFGLAGALVVTRDPDRSLNPPCGPARITDQAAKNAAEPWLTTLAADPERALVNATRRPARLAVAVEGIGVKVLRLTVSYVPDFT